MVHAIRADPIVLLVGSGLSNVLLGSWLLGNFLVGAPSLDFTNAGHNSCAGISAVCATTHLLNCFLYRRTQTPQYLAALLIEIVVFDPFVKGHLGHLGQHSIHFRGIFAVAVMDIVPTRLGMTLIVLQRLANHRNFHLLMATDAWCDADPAVHTS